MLGFILLVVAGIVAIEIFFSVLKISWGFLKFIIGAAFVFFLIKLLLPGIIWIAIPAIVIIGITAFFKRDQE